MSGVFFHSDLNAIDRAAMVVYGTNLLIENSAYIGNLSSTKARLLIDGTAALIETANSSHIRSSLGTGSQKMSFDRETFGLLVNQINSDESSPTIIENSYYSGHITRQDNAGYYHVAWPPLNMENFKVPELKHLTREDLQCSPGRKKCLLEDVLNNTHTRLSEAQPAWNFGSNSQLPTLTNFDSGTRDSDGDGVLDKDDDFPLDHAASTDSNQNGSPEEWNDFCDTECQEQSGLTLDSEPLETAGALNRELLILLLLSWIGLVLRRRPIFR